MLRLQKLFKLLHHSMFSIPRRGGAQGPLESARDFWGDVGVECSTLYESSNLSKVTPGFGFSSLLRDVRNHPGSGQRTELASSLGHAFPGFPGISWPDGAVTKFSSL